jgi:hypothetical protein
MAETSLRTFLRENKFDPAGGIRHLLPAAAIGSLRLFTHLFFFPPDRLQANQQLNVNDQIVSGNGYVNLILQGDGNLMLYRTQFGLPLWASNTAGEAVTRAIMQPDGNFVAYTAEGVAKWATGTEDHPGASLVVQSDANLVVYDGKGNAIWASNTVQDFNSPTFRYSDRSGYRYDETSERWKQLCTVFPCFAALHWTGYLTTVIDSINGQPLLIDGQAVVIQLWKGTCRKLLASNFPGGIGGEVGVYRRVPGRARPTRESLSFLPAPLAAFIVASIASLTDDQLWWAFPELNAQIEFTLSNPANGSTFLHAGPETTYWLNKWMDDDSYETYLSNQAGNVPASPTDYVLRYSINGMQLPPW